MYEIKPCPHCGGEAKLYRKFFPGYDPYLGTDDEPFICVECTCCEARGKGIPVKDDPCETDDGWDDPDVQSACIEAVAAWNLRRADPEYEAVMKDAISAIADLRKLAAPLLKKDREAAGSQ